MDMDNITGNIIRYNDFLGIDRLIRESKEKWKNWDCKLGWLIKYLLWNATGMIDGSNCVRRMENEKFIWIYCWNVAAPWKGHPESVSGHFGSVRDSPGFWTRQNGISPNNQPEAKEAPTTKGLPNIGPWYCQWNIFILANWKHQGIVYLFPLPPSLKELDTWLDEIILKCRANTSDDLIILGDFNARRREWADHRDNSKGTKLKNWMESNELERVDTGPLPTYVTARGELNCRPRVH